MVEIKMISTPKQLKLKVPAFPWILVDTYLESDDEVKTMFLKTDQVLFTEDEYQSKYEKEQKESEARFGDYSDNLVRRPKKGFLWGLGTESFDKKDSKYFQYGKLPTIKQVIRFLGIHLFKLIYLIA